MIVDANVLLRSLEGATSSQANAVRDRVQIARESGDQLTVLAATVLEVAYVLASRGPVTDGIAPTSRARSMPSSTNPRSTSNTPMRCAAHSTATEPDRSICTTACSAR